MTNKTPETIIWKAPSHIRQHRSLMWYMIFGLISLGFIAYAVYTRSFMVGLTFVLIILVLLILTMQPSSEVTYKITKTGIVAGNQIYPFKIIKKFWIVYNPPEVKTLNLETTAYLNNRVILQLGSQDPVAVKLLLNNYIPEDLEKEESISEALARRLKI